MSRKSVRRAALGLLVAVLLMTAMPVPASAWLGGETGGETGGSSTGFFVSVWEWLQDLWPQGPDPIRPACTDCTDAGYGIDPNG
ncbi:MAG TPA: hypothetical protein VNM67_06665 [Thermoanaerobaculia bacterium]|jgi:hypothetical protein|nr:hypothetical protein [Thermoanaerobaculia bacterium]